MSAQSDQANKFAREKLGAAVDSGVQRALSGEIGGLRGEQYENAMIAQILITLRNLGVRAEASYFRTGGGLEVD